MKSVVSVMLVLVAIGSCAHRAVPAGTPATSEDQFALLSDSADEGTTAPPRDCTTTVAAPPEGRIASFPPVGSGTDFAGTLVTYPRGSSAAPTVTTEGGALHIAANVPVGAKAQYVGAFLGFPTCTDASAYAGVRFSLRGTYSGCSLEYATTDVEHQDRSSAAEYATGGRGAYPPQTRLDRSEVTQIARTMSMPFSGQSIRGNPALPLDTSKLTGLVWQLTVPLAANVVDGTRACVAALDIDDVAFYR
jgi:hypothetical protein